MLFARFDATLRAPSYIAMSGQLIDVTLVAAPKRRNTEEERKAIKEGRVPEAWAERPARLRQKDRDARWTVKFSKAKERSDGTKHPSTSPSRLSAIRTISRSTGASGSSGSGRRPTPRPMKARVCGKAARQEQHRVERLGRHGLSLGSQRDVHGEERLPNPGSSQEAKGAAHAGDCPPRQRHQINRPIACRACLRRMGPFVRTIGIARARVKIGMTKLDYSFKRPVFWRRIAAA